jgi:magnesium-transporting ATPase (P-type)
MSMHEELAQVQYLFCDKTGTITKNQLTFREMKVAKGGAAKTTLNFGSNRDESGTIEKSLHSKQQPKMEDVDEDAAFPSSI